MPSVLQNYYQNNYKPISQKGLFWGSVMRAQNKVPNFDPMLCTLSVVTQFEFNILKFKKKNISRFSWKLLSLSYLIYKKEISCLTNWPSWRYYWTGSRQVQHMDSLAMEPCSCRMCLSTDLLKWGRCCLSWRMCCSGIMDITDMSLGYIMSSVSPLVLNCAGDLHPKRGLNCDGSDHRFPLYL